MAGAALSALSLAPRRLSTRGGGPARAQVQATAVAPEQQAADGGGLKRPTLRRSPRAALPAGERTAATRTVVCGDAIAWLEQRTEPLPCVITSLPDVTELQGPPLFISTAAEYKLWFRRTVGTIVSKLGRGCCAVFYQTDTWRDGVYIDKAYLCGQGAEDAGGAQLFHKIALRQEVGVVRLGKIPGFTHWLAFASPLGMLQSQPPGAVSVPDVIFRGDVAWGKATGVDAAVWTARYLRNDIGAKEVCDPFCGSGTVLAAANHLGLNALGVEISAKRARHAMVLQLWKSEDGQLLARRSTDRPPEDDGDGGDEAPADSSDAETEAAPVAVSASAEPAV